MNFFCNVEEYSRNFKLYIEWQAWKERKNNKLNFKLKGSFVSEPDGKRVENKSQGQPLEEGVQKFLMRCHGSL